MRVLVKPTSDVRVVVDLFALFVKDAVLLPLPPVLSLNLEFQFVRDLVLPKV